MLPEGLAEEEADCAPAAEAEELGGSGSVPGLDEQEEPQVRFCVLASDNAGLYLCLAASDSSCRMELPQGEG